MGIKNSQEKIALAASEVCEILRTCGEAQVAELKFGPLHVIFGRSTDNAVEVSQSTATDTVISDAQLKQARESFEMDELRVRQEQLEELLITNPSKYEELLANGELEELEDGPEDT